MSIKQIHSCHLGRYIVPSDCRGGVCVDVGGNTGQFALAHQNFFRKIHIYEPQKDCCEIIRNNILAFNNINVFEEAVDSASGNSVKLISHHSRDSGSVAVDSNVIQVKEWNPNDIVNDRIKTVCLGTVLARVGGAIDYLKVDCETSEYNFLMNKDLSKIKYLGIELHWQMGETNFNQLVSYILQYFNNTSSSCPSYPNGHNIETFFVSKFLV